MRDIVQGSIFDCSAKIKTTKFHKMTPIILAGGSGTRLWPLSRQAYPKQFRAFLSEDTLFAMTLERLRLANWRSPVAVCADVHRFLLEQQLHEANINDVKVILEPVSKNTAPAIALAILETQAQTADGDDEFLVLPSDHLIVDDNKWRTAIDKGRQLLADGHIVCLGAEPTHADNNYGYIQRAEALSEGAYRIAVFKEKPDLATAQDYVDKGDCYWNCGMFILRGKDYLAALKKYAPEILNACQDAVSGAQRETDLLLTAGKAYSACPDISIDYAVMEHIECGAVLPISCGWSDLGNWASVWAASNKDAQGNVASGDVIHEDCTNNIFMSTSRLLAAVNVHDLIAVETEDAVMVASKDHPQDVKKLYMRLSAEGHKASDASGRVYRPWGYYQSLKTASAFQVKIISVNPQARLSLQKHHRRAEHWVVVEGQASVQCEDKEFTLETNQHTHIPIGAKHRLSNMTDKPLRVIEVQIGDYLGEDDIVRFADIYGRSQS